VANGYDLHFIALHLHIRHMVLDIVRRILRLDINAPSGFYVWIAFLSIFEVLIQVIFGLKARKGKPSGTVAHYIAALSIFSFLWIANFIILVLFLDEVISILSLLVVAFRLFHIFTICKQAYKYFPPDLIFEKESLEIEFVGDDDVLPEANVEDLRLTAATQIDNVSISVAHIS